MKVKFSITNYAEVVIKGKSIEEARQKLTDNLNDYEDEMLNGECIVSDGVEEE